MAREPTVSEARLFRLRGVAQFGVDVVCIRRFDDGCEVAQLKRYRTFSKADIRRACDLFFKHLAYWKGRKVKRFVLMVTEPLQGEGQDEQLVIEIARFAEEGIRFESWSVYGLTQRLRPWPDIVVRAFGHNADYWVQNICGRRLVPYALPPTTRKGAQAATATERQFAELIPLATAGMSAQLDRIRTVARSGRMSHAISMLTEIQEGGTTWASLPDELRARALRLQASLVLEQASDLATAKRLLDEAFVIDLEPAWRLQAHIVMEEQGPAAALEFIDGCGQSDDDLARLAAVCHLRNGKPKAASDKLSGLGGGHPDAETSRLRALAAISLGDTDEAVREIERAVADEPGSWAVAMSHGIVLYLSSVSAAAYGDLAIAWPPPCDWLAVRRDDQSTDRMRRAATVFAGMMVDGQERVQREHLEGWRLACLANDAERQAEAESYCRTLLGANPTHPAAITWAMARAYPTAGKAKVFDVAVSRRALEDLLDAGRGGLEHLGVLATMALVAGKPERIPKLVSRYATLFAFPGGSEHRSELLAEAAVRSGQVVSPRDTVRLDPKRIALLAAVREPDEDRATASLVDIVARCEANGDASGVRLDALLRLAQLQRLTAVATHSDWLAHSVGTADALRLAAYAKDSVGDAPGALSILDTASSAFPGSRLPHDLESLRARCHAKLGDLPLATSIMRSVAAAQQGVPTAVLLADLHVRRGNLEAASSTLAPLVTNPELPPEHALRFAKLLVHDDPALARTLWDRAAAVDIGPEWLPTMLDVARRLGVGPESAFIVERMVASAPGIGEDAPGTPFRSLTLEQLTSELADLRRETEYLAGVLERGEAPLHILAPKLGLSFPVRYSTATSRRGNGAATALSCLGSTVAGQSLARFRRLPQPGACTWT